MQRKREKAEKEKLEIFKGIGWRLFSFEREVPVSIGSPS